MRIQVSQGGMDIPIFMWEKVAAQQLIWMKSKSQLGFLLGWNKLFHSRLIGIKKFPIGKLHTPDYSSWNQTLIGAVPILMGIELMVYLSKSQSPGCILNSVQLLSQYTV